MASPMVSVITFVVSLLGGATASSLCAPERLRTEYESAPLGIDVKHPRFSFALCALPQNDKTRTTARGLAQYAYDIEVTDAEAYTTYWSSGTTVSNRTTNIPFAGPVLPADHAFSWRVR